MPGRRQHFDRLLTWGALLLLLRDGVARMLSIGYSSIWIDEWLQWMNAWRPADRWWLGQGLGETFWIVPVRLLDAPPAAVVAGLRTLAFVLTAIAGLLVWRTLRRTAQPGLGWIALAASPWLLAHAAAGRPFGPAMAGLALVAVSTRGSHLFGTALALLHPVSAAFLCGTAVLQRDWKIRARLSVGALAAVTLLPTVWFLWAGRPDYPPLAQAVLQEAESMVRTVTLDAPAAALVLAVLSALVLGANALRHPHLRHHGLIVIGWLATLMALRAFGAPMLARYTAPAFVWAWLRCDAAAGPRLTRSLLALMVLVSLVTIPTLTRHSEAFAPATGIPTLPVGRPCRVVITTDSALAALTALDQLSTSNIWLPGAIYAPTWLPFDQRNARCAIAGSAWALEILGSGTTPAYRHHAFGEIPNNAVGWRRFGKVDAGALFTWTVDAAPPVRAISGDRPYGSY